MIFLFTKIDHPSLFQKLGTPDADHILASQYFRIEEILQAHGVHWAKRTPTGLLSLFEGGDPAQAALALQKEFKDRTWASFGKAEIVVVLHAGEADRFGQTYVGPEMNHALKLLEASRGGQILLTSPAVHFVPLPPGGGLMDLGPVFLKNLSQPGNVYALQHESLATTGIFLPRSLQNYPQNFNPQASPFFGREEEINEIREILKRPPTRLLTLKGPGGFGKTRLAFQASAEVVETFKDGVFWVVLAPLLSDQLIVGAIANAIKFFFYGLADPKDQLLGHLREKEMLFVLDNFEHLIDGSKLVGEILAAAPGVKIIATSRESLRIEGEQLFEVGGLRYPTEGQPEDLEAFSAIQLFLKSAKRIRPDFVLKAEDRPWMLKICGLLEGMPLGLELSATWLGILSPREIAGKIENSNDFLATAMPHLPPRHRSLRAVFEYSWILLSETQKKILRAISVFKGGFREDAARQVSGATVSLLASLANKSLLHQRPDGRFEIHELLKYYAKEKLYGNPSEKESAFDAHCLCFAQLLRGKQGELFDPAQNNILEEMMKEMENIDEGWKRAMDPPQEERMEDYLDCYFFIHEVKGWFRKGEETFRKAVEVLKESGGSTKRLPKKSAVLLGKVLSRWASFLRQIGDIKKSKKIFEESLELLESRGALKQAGFPLSGLAAVWEALGDDAKSKAYYKKTFETYRKAKDRNGMAFALNYLGHHALKSGNQKAALSYGYRGLALYEATKNLRGMAQSFGVIGDALQELGNAKESREYYQKGLSACISCNNRIDTAWFFISLGNILERMGKFT